MIQTYKTVACTIFNQFFTILLNAIKTTQMSWWDGNKTSESNKLETRNTLNSKKTF